MTEIDGLEKTVKRVEGGRKKTTNGPKTSKATPLTVPEDRPIKATPDRWEDAKVAGIEQTMLKEFNVHMKLDPSIASMLSLPTRTGERNAYLLSLLKQFVGGKINIVDGYACVGGDTLSWLKLALENGIEMDVHAVQRKEGGRFEKLKQYTNEFLGLFKNPCAQATLYGMPIEKFIQEYLQGQIHMLYLDPPWNIPEGFDLKKNCGSRDKPSIPTLDLVNRLEAEVFGPLHSINYPPPLLVCIKAPTPFVEFSKVLPDTCVYLRSYGLKKSIPFVDKRGKIRLYYHILEVNPMSNVGAAEFVPAT